MANGDAKKRRHLDTDLACTKCSINDSDVIIFIIIIIK